ncbi:hypothetical protein CsSME_00034210 [Camellia sinensis var. sinensis]
MYAQNGKVAKRGEGGQPPQPGATGPQLRRFERAVVPSTKYPASQYILITDDEEAESFSEAKSHTEKDCWMQTMKEEMSSLQKNHTYELIPFPKDRRALKNKWVYKLKKDGNGPAQ